MKLRTIKTIGIVSLILGILGLCILSAFAYIHTSITWNGSIVESYIPQYNLSVLWLLIPIIVCICEGIYLGIVVDGPCYNSDDKAAAWGFGALMSLICFGVIILLGLWVLIIPLGIMSIYGLIKFFGWINRVIVESVY